MPTYKICDVPKYNHISRSCIILDNRVYKQSISMKPRGFYYSNDLDWLKYKYNSCINEDIIFIDEYLYETKILCEKVSLNEEEYDQLDKIILLKSYDDIKTFTKKFDCLQTKIDWIDVSEYCSGIEIQNYDIILEEYRNETNDELKNNNMWFTGFDVNSGCIWNVAHLEITKCG